MMDLTPFAAGIEEHSHIVLNVSCNEKAQISIITGISPDLRILDLESQLTAQPSTAKDWIIR
jgi:hypothetical protein